MNTETFAPPEKETVTTLCNTQGYNRKLSALQKRILVYARNAMIAKGQEIDNSAIRLEIPAPKWLSDALVKAMEGVFEGRKWFQREGEQVELGMHRWIRVFDEVFYIQNTIQNAASEAGIKDSRVHLSDLYKICDSDTDTLLHLFAMSAGGQRIFNPWPLYRTGKGWYFLMELQGGNVAKSDLPKELDLVFGVDRWKDKIRLAPDGYDINCTIPEMLRDLYEFPVTGHVDALAFSPDKLGRRYYVAQAALRRSCLRLQDRDLIVIRSGRCHSLSWSLYERSGIGLTPSGVALADKLLEATGPDK